ncbi:MAG: hypothetical protein Q8R29_00030 [bacterium]|nr:hypothetical protein [bacterium]
MVLQTWGDVVVASLQEVWTGVANFLPLLIGALIVFVVGWVVAVAVGKLVEQIVDSLRIDKLLMKLSFHKVWERAGWKTDSGAFVGALVRWFLIVVFLLAAVNVLGLTQVSDFLRAVVLYLPNVIVAALILVIAAVVADAVEKLLRGSVEAMGYKGSLAGVVVRWAIWVFAVVAALLQLGIATALVQTMVTGLVAVLVLAFGLAFGLGGKEAAADAIYKLRNELKK